MIAIAKYRRGAYTWHPHGGCVRRHSRTTTGSSFLFVMTMMAAITTVDSRSNADGEEEEDRDVGDTGEDGEESRDCTSILPLSVSEDLGFMGIGGGGGPQPPPPPPRGIVTMRGIEIVIGTGIRDPSMPQIGGSIVLPAQIEHGLGGGGGTERL